MRLLVKGAVTIFGVLALLMLYFNVVTIPGGYGASHTVFVKAFGMYSPLVVFLLTAAGTLVLWWSERGARALLLAAALMQALVVMSMYVFVWGGTLPTPALELFSGRAFTLGLPVVIVCGMIVLLSQPAARARPTS